MPDEMLSCSVSLKSLSLGLEGERVADRSVVALQGTLVELKIAGGRAPEQQRLCQAREHRTPRLLPHTTLRARQATRRPTSSWRSKGGRLISKVIPISEEMVGSTRSKVKTTVKRR